MQWLQMLTLPSLTSSVQVKDGVTAGAAKNWRQLSVAGRSSCSAKRRSSLVARSEMHTSQMSLGFPVLTIWWGFSWKKWRCGPLLEQHEQVC